MAFPFLGLILLHLQACPSFGAHYSVSYKLAPASDEFLIFILNKMFQIARPELFARSIHIHRMERIFQSEPSLPIDFSALMKESISSRLLTLTILSKRNRTLVDFSRFADSFLFQLSFNLDSAVVPQRYLEDLVRPGRLARMRRNSLEDLDPPKRFYLSDLVYHYQLGVASDSPPLEYLSYYHIIEHFFEDVFNDELIEKVRSKLTQPDFSSRRKKDIGNLIKEISKSLRFKGENTTFSELEACRLVLTRYVRLGELLDKIRGYDSSLVQYYKTNIVSFCQGEVVNLEETDIETILAKLSRRIYRTRNAIVHSKEGDKDKYIPFEHDKILIKELPLLRFIAEIIIIESSTPMP